MNTTHAIADRLTRATIRANVQAIEPMIIIALVQALTQVVMACMAKPDDAARYLSCADVRPHRFRHGLRVRRMKRAIAREWAARGGHPARLADVQRAVFLECATITPDVVADLYADIRAAKGDA